MRYSIIVPVYNVEKYLKKCLDSLLAQTYDDIEIITVNDGSVDSSLDILKEYGKKNGNILVYSQENKGVVLAREYGLKKASGDYCLMMDADDWLREDAIERIDDYLKKFGNIDVLKFRFEYKPSARRVPFYEINDRILNEQELSKVRRDLILTSKYNNLSNQVFKIELYNKVTGMHDERVDYGEDNMVNLDIIGKSERIVFVNDVLYYYNHENQNSTTHRFNLKKLSKDISNIICVNKKRERYLEVFQINDIDVSELKRKTVMFACNQIKNYVIMTKRINSAKLLKSVSESGLYDYWDGSHIDNLGYIERKICECIKNKSFDELKWIKPYLLLKVSLKKLYFKSRQLVKH